VPSKCVIRSSRSYADIAAAGGFGVRTLDGTQIDFAAVMERMRRLRASISEHDSVWRFQSLGVDVFLGEGRFSGPDTVAIGGQTLRFKQAVLATGGRAVVPPVPGLAQAGFLTNETVFDLTERPARLACLGAGPIGCELAQAFRRLGCEVSLFHTGSHVLNKEDPEAAEIVQRVFEREGIRLFLDCQVTAVERANGVKVIHYRNGGGEAALEADEILVAVGRVPNVEGLGLEVAGVRYDRARGVEVNDRLQTTNPRIFAAGDVCMDWRFTHAADAAARIVIQNALFFGRKKLSRLTMPWCTYTDPEVAHVGIYPYEAERRGIPVDTFVRDLKEVDRALADGEEEGFVKVHVRKGTDRILGATLVARHAGEMVSEITLAMAANIGLTRLSGVIHPYPTQSEAIKQVGDLYNRTRLTPTIRKWFERYLACRR
jgi:pyruvate/2-oxoglutarate dehydrogenase complex dihydrolipoamide dehydrogenase (E3) component